MTVSSRPLESSLACMKAAEASRWRAFASRVAPLRDTLMSEFTRRTQEQSPLPMAAFATDDGRGLVLMLPPGAEHPRLLAGQDGSCVLDFAALDEPGPERLIGDLAIPSAGGMVYYTVDVDGSDEYLVRACALDGQGRPRTLAGGAGPSIGWDAGSGRVVFTTLDDAMRPSTAWAIDPATGLRQQICTASSAAEYLDLGMSSDGGTVLIATQTHSSRAVALLGAGSRLLPLWGTGTGGRAQADCCADRVALIRSVRGQPDRLHTARLPPAGDPPASWRCVYEAPPEACLDCVVCCAGHALVVERANGSQRLVRVSLTDHRAAPVPFGAPGASDACSIQVLPGTRRTGDPVALLQESWQHPARWVTVDPRTGHVGAGGAPGRVPVQAAELDVVRLSVPSDGGATVPLTLLRPAGRRGELPTVLFGYGSYGVPMDPAYSPFRQSLLDRGVAFAVAHVRGGGDLGPQWHEAGRGLNKPNAVADYLAAARYLTEHGWTPGGKIIARAQSAGAAVAAAAINRAPELFAAAVLEAPFLDCLDALLDPDAPLTATGWDEWGDPRTDQAAMAMLAALSPLDNIAAAPYPAFMLTTGENDSRISASGPLRFAAAIRAATTTARDVLVRTDVAGHLGHSSTTADSLGQADILAFMLDQLGLGDG